MQLRLDASRNLRRSPLSQQPWCTKCRLQADYIKALQPQEGTGRDASVESVEDPGKGVVVGLEGGVVVRWEK